MLSYRSTSFNKVENADRFDSKYFFLEDILEIYQFRNDFELIDLGDERLLINITDGEHAGQIFVEEGVLFIKNSSVKDFDISLVDGFYISEEKHEILERSALQKEDILFTTIGHLGSAAIVSDNFGEANINQNLVKIVIDNKVMDPYYLCAYLNSSLIKKQIASLFTGNIHGILTYPKLKKLKIVKPNNSFQSEISKLFKLAIEYEMKSNKIIINAKDKLKDYLGIDFKKIKKQNNYSVNFSQMRDNNIWTPKFFYPKYVNSLNAMKKKWNFEQLGSKKGLSSINTGKEPGSKNYNNYLDKNESDYAYIRTSDIYNFQMDLFPDNYVPLEIANDLNFDIAKDDIIFTKDGKIGRCCIVTQSDHVVPASGLAIIRSKDINPYYLFLNLILEEVGGYQAIQRTVYASTIPHLRKNRLEEFEIPLIDEKLIIELSNQVKEAFSLKEQKKKIILEIKNKLNRLLDPKNFD